MDLLLLAPDIQEQILSLPAVMEGTTRFSDGSCGIVAVAGLAEATDGCGLLGRDGPLTAADIRLLPKRQLQMPQNLLVWQIGKDWEVRGVASRAASELIGTHDIQIPPSRRLAQSFSGSVLS